MIFKLLVSSLFCICTLHNFAQEKSKIKFGKISPEDFSKTVYSIDSSASAVIIADMGSTEMVGNNKNSFSLEFKNYRRAHILNKNGYDIANVEIRIYTDGRAEEELQSLKAVTYNLENGKVVETKLEVKTAVFKDKISKNLLIKKFTFPNIKEGSIIEYEYKLHSDFTFNLQPWDFQGEYPCLWSEYNVAIPEFYYYVTLSQGYQPFYIKGQKARLGNFTVADVNTASRTERGSFQANITDFRWVMKDVPALKEESYTSTINNHLARIQFQLAELRHPYVPKNIMGTWQQVCTELLKDEDFGFALNRDNGWLSDVVKEATRGATGKLEKAKNIFAYVRDNMTCTNYNRTSLDKSIKNVLKDKSGNEAEINLLLTAMLLKADLEAEPVMLSTRSHGYAYELYPILDRFNYVISRMEADGKYYYLDASKPRMGFGRLGYDSYNGHARVINQTATPLELIADSLLERRATSVIIINDGKGNLTGSLRQMPGYYESYSLRNRIQEKGKDQLFSDIKKAFTAEIDVIKPEIDSLDKFEQPLNIHYEFNLKTDKEDIIYFNPMFGEAWKENPFKSAERAYPVEMPYTIDQTYIMQLDIPAGYIIDEMPKSMIVKLNEDDDGRFEYRLSESGGTISLRSVLRLNRAFFLPDEYEMLREFFNMVVKKQGEQIVFKKKS
ncbi:MAG: transglutaminase domain-containing protein [Chitinophagaceae bacterium]